MQAIRSTLDVTNVRGTGTEQPRDQHMATTTCSRFLTASPADIAATDGINATAEAISWQL
jgi:hypothetical protein